MNVIILTMALTCFGLTHASAQEVPLIPDLAAVADANAWRLIHATAESLEVDGKRAVRLTAEGDSATGIVGLALPAGLSFATGIIEIDLKGKTYDKEASSAWLST